jgi:hypothetical protein
MEPVVLCHVTRGGRSLRKSCAFNNSRSLERLVNQFRRLGAPKSLKLQGSTWPHLTTAPKSSLTCRSPMKIIPAASISVTNNLWNDRGNSFLIFAPPRCLTSGSFTFTRAIQHDEGYIMIWLSSPRCSTARLTASLSHLRAS